MSKREIQASSPLADPFDQTIWEMGEYIKQKYFALKDHKTKLDIFDKYLSKKLEPKINKFK